MPLRHGQSPWQERELQAKLADQRVSGGARRASAEGALLHCVSAALPVPGGDLERPLRADPVGGGFPRRCHGLASEMHLRRARKRKTEPLWGRPGSPAPPGPSLSLEGTGGARKASLPPGYLSALPPGAREPVFQCQTLAALDDKPQISQQAQRSGNPKKICGNLSNLWMPARSLRSERKGAHRKRRVPPFFKDFRVLIKGWWCRQKQSLPAP
jgi:hypothetical protein